MDSGRLIVDDSGHEVAHLRARPSTSDLTVCGNGANWKFDGVDCSRCSFKVLGQARPGANGNHRREKALVVSDFLAE
jgi:hypothetical protein